MKKLLFLLLFFIVSLSHAATHHSDHHYKVIIIGAGIAGLEAAHYLQQQGVTDYIILEARDRIGGRTWTIPWHNINIDLGATWIHGAGTENPLMKIVEKNHFTTQAINIESSVLYNSSGEILSDSTEAFYRNLYDQFIKLVSDKHNNIHKNSNLTVSNVAVEFLKSHHLDKNTESGFLYEVSDNIEEEYAADIKDLSALWFDNDEGYVGVDRVPLHGYGEIVNYLAKNLGEHILLKNIVTKIDYQNKESITITTADGKKFNGKYVVCTLPLGVLKKKTVEFIPKLPKEKLIALEHLNMGIMNKIILLFPRMFWDTKEFIGYVPPAYWSGKEWVHKGEWVEIDNMVPFLHQPILSALVAADFARQLEDDTDEQIIKKVMQVLRTLYGKSIPEPSAYLVTRWGKDPFSEGSYSSLRPDALNKGEDYVNMAKTVDDRLLFAGEATSVLYPGTVYGAYLSGDRAAVKILKQIMDKA